MNTIRATFKVGNMGIVKTISSKIIECTNFNFLKPFRENRYGGFKEQEEFVTEKEKINFRNHVERIKESMIEFGKSLGLDKPLYDDREPIVVFVINGEHYIVDGQHRYIAAMELGIPFYIRIVESDLRDKDGARLDNTFEYARSYFYRVNNNTKVGGSMNWNTYNSISSSARNGNKVAQFICNLCNDNNLFDVTVLNNKCGEKIKVEGKKGAPKKYTACELYEYGYASYEDIIKRIKIFANVSLLIAQNSFDKFSFKNNESKLNKYRKLLRNDRFTNAINIVINNEYPLDAIIKICKFNSSGIIPGATAPKAYLAMWGINY